MRCSRRTAAVPAAAGTAQPAPSPAADALVGARMEAEAARGAQGGRGGGGGAARARRGGGARPQPYDRNKFLQANFRFLVSDAGDLRRWEANADLMPDWEDVVEARPARAAGAGRCSGLFRASPRLPCKHILTLFTWCFGVCAETLRSNVSGRMI
jgi:hypothetical protein